MSPKIARRLVVAAYNLGWRHACDDHNTQRFNEEHPIGHSRLREWYRIVDVLDPHNILGLRR